jgi:phenylalanyl-tRNA synthetase alpha chain
MVGEGVNFGDLKAVLHIFLRRFCRADVEVRFEPDFFPFTEPSAQVHCTCMGCRGKGCETCSYTGWLEILGCGMVHPNVFEAVGYDTERYTGFAFGMGMDRLAMLKHAIPDGRLFFQGDVRFLRQF